MHDGPRADGDRRFRGAEARVLWGLWLTYGTYYFCRNNLAVAQPGLKSELALTGAEMGTILAAFKLTYGVGQLLNGQLAERVRAKILLTIGLLASAALTFGVGTAGGFWLVFIL